MRIAIVNDVTLAVEALRRVLSRCPEHEIAWIAVDGAEAVRKCAGDRPDLVLMDLMMPVMDGAEATRLIMEETPCAILVVTATVGGHSRKVFEAMGHGALDAVNTPVLGPRGETRGAEPLLEKISIIGRLIGKSARPPLRPGPPQVRAVTGAPGFPLVAIGSSTGGPKALLALLKALPDPLSAALVVIQHVDVRFAAGLASWLNEQVLLRVRLMEPPEGPQKGSVLLAATNDHVVLQSGLSFKYTAEPADFPYRPSVDVFFRSVCEFWPGTAIGVLLTGIGRDGAEGLLAMRRRGWHTIAQDESTSVVYGMPKAAAELGAAVEVLPVQKIAAAIVGRLESRRAVY